MSLRGAEAVLFLEDWMGMRVLVKERIRKRYRRVDVDEEIRRFRTINEARLMIKARRLGIPVPRVFDVDPINARIRMEYIEGPTLRQIMMRGDSIDVVLRAMRRLGRYVGILHKSCITHGDATPANLILRDGDVDKAYLVDFGLSEVVCTEPTRDPRIHHKFAIDINVTLRSIEASYRSLRDDAFSSFCEGYAEIMGQEDTSLVIRRMMRIRRMVRYAVDH